MHTPSTFRAGRTVAVLAAAVVFGGSLIDTAPAAAQDYTTPVVTRRPPTSQATGGQQPIPESAREASVLRRVRGGTPDGIPVGSFVFFPRLEVDGEYDDNIYRTRNNRQDDLIFRVRPGFSLSSDWTTHSLELYGQGELARYADFSSENYEAYSVGGRVRIDIDDDLAWLTDADASRNRLPRGAPGLLGTPIGNNTIVNTYTLGTQLAYSGDPFFGRIGPRYRRIDYVRGTPSSENFNVYDINARVGYRVTPDLSVFIDPTYQWVDYDRRTDGAGFKRNNQGIDVRLGVSYDIASTITAELGAGYFRRWYSDSRLKADGGLSVLGRLFWNPTDTISVEAEARRSMSEYRAALANAATVGNAIETYFGLRVGWSPVDQLLLDVGGAYSRYRYRGAGSNENYWFFDAGAKYFLTTNFYVGPRYYFEHRGASPSALNYTDNRFLLTLGAQL